MKFGLPDYGNNGDYGDNGEPAVGTMGDAGQFDKDDREPEKVKKPKPEKAQKPVNVNTTALKPGLTPDVRFAGSTAGNSQAEKDQLYLNQTQSGTVQQATRKQVEGLAKLKEDNAKLTPEVMEAARLKAFGQQQQPTAQQQPAQGKAEREWKHREPRPSDQWGEKFKPTLVERLQAGEGNGAIYDEKTRNVYSLDGKDIVRIKPNGETDRMDARQNHENQLEERAQSKAAREQQVAQQRTQTAPTTNLVGDLVKRGQDAKYGTPETGLSKYGVAVRARIEHRHEQEGKAVKGKPLSEEDRSKVDAYKAALVKQDQAEKSKGTMGQIGKAAHQAKGREAADAAQTPQSRVEARIANHDAAMQRQKTMQERGGQKYGPTIVEGINQSQDGTFKRGDFTYRMDGKNVVETKSDGTEKRANAEHVQKHETAWREAQIKRQDDQTDAKKK